MKPILNVIRLIILTGAVGILSSCSAVVSLQPQVSQLSSIGSYDQALKIIDQPQKYGGNNELLRLLDQGMILHYAARYDESIAVFEQAKEKAESLYTQSLSRIAASYLWNDYTIPYAGEDFERVLINVIQAVNYAALEKWDDALVEARQVDSLLNAINDRYDAKHKNFYQEDAFARLLMGILYETKGNLNDAIISYRMSWQAYENDYQKYYQTHTPLVLKQNLLAAAQAFGDRDGAEYQNAFQGVDFQTIEEKSKKAQVYVIEYQGLSPSKVSRQFPLPLPDGYVTSFNFPVYQSRSGQGGKTKVMATIKDQSINQWDVTQLGENIEGIAKKNLEDRRLRMMAKEIVRVTGKYVVEKQFEQSVGREHGQGGADLVKIVSSIFNVISDQADTRSWQTLPREIRVGRLILDPGSYVLTVGGENTAELDLKAGDVKIIPVYPKF